MALTAERGVDVASVVADGGRIANIGVHGPVQLNLEKLWDHNVTLTTRLVDAGTIPMAMKTVASGKVRPKQLTTHPFVLTEAMKTYDTFSQAMRERVMKVMIRND